MTQAVKLAQLGSPGISTGFKNRIINGAMVIDQRNAGAAVTGINAAGFYTVDRWKSMAVNTWGGSGVVFTAQQNKGSVTPPANFTNYLGISPTTGNASLGSTTTLDLTQVIEGYNMADLGWGTSSAKTVTLSFWVYSNLTGTFGGSVTNSAYNRSYVFSYTINAANTWEQKSVTISGDTSGTWLTTNGLGANISFSLGAGSSMMTTPGSWSSSLFSAPTGQQQICASTSNNFYITGVQLEVGTTATDFEYRDYGRELLMCQRYYWKIAGDNSDYPSVGSGTVQNANGARIHVKHPVSMRTYPTFSYGGTLNIDNGGFVASGVTSISGAYEGLDTSMLDFGASSGGLTSGRGVVVYCVNASTNFLQASAEI